MAIVIMLFTNLWYVALMIAFIPLFWMANNYVIWKNYRATEDLSPKRKIKKVTTLVIGDVCSHKELSSVINEDETLFFTCPYRTLPASYQILLHTVSRIDEKGLVVIIDKKQPTKFQHTIFDVNFYSQITKKELGLEFSKNDMRFPFFKHPIVSFMILVGCYSKNYKTELCPNEAIQEFCNKKNIKLLYLTK
ncbi:MAG: hypothetical protein VZQ98_08535 [Bacteroidales bacterium]|nr:hypothetical protein [Bacteroidales bacterium]